MYDKLCTERPENDLKLYIYHMEQYITWISNDHMTLLLSIDIYKKTSAQLLHHIQACQKLLTVQSENVSTGSGTVYRSCS